MNSRCGRVLVFALVCTANIFFPSCQIQRTIQESTNSIQDNSDSVQRSTYVITKNGDAIEVSTGKIIQNAKSIEDSSNAVKKNVAAVEATSEKIRANGELIDQTNRVIKGNIAIVQRSTEAILANSKAIEQATGQISGMNLGAPLTQLLVLGLLVLFLTPSFIGIVLAIQLKRALKMLAKMNMGAK